jgi:hypothetical protein
LGQSGAAWNAWMKCWSNEVYIPELAPRFWRLSLQVCPTAKWSGKRDWADDRLSLDLDLG